MPATEWQINCLKFQIVANSSLFRIDPGINPDDAAIPYLTALGDLIGTGLLSLAFYLLFLIGDRDEDVGE